MLKDFYKKEGKEAVVMKPEEDAWPVLFMLQPSFFTGV